MDGLEIINSRQSIRKFKSDRIPKEIIEQIVNAGRLAPTANNVQPWEFVVVTNQQKRTKLAEITEYGKFTKDAPVCIVVISKDTKYHIEDGSAAVENILLAAWYFGIGSCWVAGDKKPYANDILNLFDVPAGYKLVASIPIGYPLELPKRANKRPLQEVIHWEKF
jgi:nitroreductase